MRMGIGLGVGINRSNYAQGIFGAYATRVVADGGVVEGGACVDAVSGLLQSASLLLVPSGYKGGKLYAEIPTNGNGDLTWTRGGDGFRTNASGLIQRVPWNLLQYSEQFDNSAWIKNNATITSNAINAPNGTLTADKLIETTANGVHNAVFVLTPNVTTYTASFYAKAAERNFVYYSFGGPSWGGQGFMVNLTTGAVSQNTTGATPTVTLLPDGWVKIEASRAAVSTTQIQFQIFTGLDSTTFSYTGDSTKGIFIWGAQLVEGTTAQTYLPTTDRLNFPRLSYMYGSCPAVLLEPQRTNLYPNSNTFSSWVKAGVTSSITANSGISPDGTNNAWYFSAISGVKNLRQDIALVGGSVYTITLYVKSYGVGNNTFRLGDGGSASTLTAITATSTWQRATYTFTCASTGTRSVGIFQDASDSAIDVLIYGAQLEAGAYPTTYIPTTSATATRVADSFSRNNIYTNGLITASGGTWFVELRGNVAYTRDGINGVFIGDSTTPNSGNQFIIRNAGGLARLSVVNYVASTLTSVYTTNTDIVKLAIKWNGSTADIFANGTKVISATSFTPTNMENLIGNGGSVPLFIQQMALYTEPLTDTKLIELTTL
jgi:hypothetical protein